MQQNIKPDGTPYNLYKDGIKIYTTINYDMQRYAEWAMQEHLKNELQPAFYANKKGDKNAPFSKKLTREERSMIIDQAIRRSERYRTMRQNGVSIDSIYKSFRQPAEMRMFTWNSEVDTVMTPIDSIIYYKFFLHAGLMSVEPTTGHVKAYVGGINSKHFQYDHVKLAKRQAGSTFKPFLYILAMQEGMSPCHKVPVVPQTFIDHDTIWIPNTTCRPELIGTRKTLKWGLANSENYISAWLLKQFNPASIVEIAHRMGIESQVDAVPSMIYGVADVNVYEMVSAFSSFANKGVNAKPIFVSRIEDRYGNVLATFTTEKREAISEETAYLMLNLLEGVINRGSGIWLRTRYGFTAQIAGKTGTTQNHSDGWFIGVTPKLVTGIWVGAEDRSVHFDNLAQGQGAHMALPIWGLYMDRVYNDSSLNITQADTFLVPDNINVNINCEEMNVVNEGDFNPDEYELGF
ncbi:MAG: hypothetical protein HC896_00555 [Bacteroidales bacterium]|nr:hypothetical protein [Bacteroidales bacterium]